MIKCLYELRGRYGLCKIGYGDWNDSLTGIGRSGSGVSVWLSHALVYAVKNFKEIVQLKKDMKRLKYFNEIIENMTSNLNNYGWDKTHYAYAVNDEGDFVGNNNSKEGTYHINASTWALMNGVADSEDLSSKIFKTLEKVNTPLGHHLISPPYSRSQFKNLGRIADITPGMFENGSIYIHGQAFVIFALLQKRQGTRAWEELKKILPSSTLPDISTGPLHQIPNCVVGTAHEKFGLHLYSNFTGAIAWIRRSIQLMVGVIPELAGIRIDPCVPNHWKEISVKRIFRDNSYHIDIRNPEGLETGVKSVKVNNQSLEPEKGKFLIPYEKVSKPIKVEVTMGA